jgi:tetratricopeptide (TPR) repeat protein
MSGPDHADPAAPESHLSGLGPRFLGALKLRVDGRVDDALDAFREILRLEPRLAEPRLELGRIHLEMGQLEEAESQAREALRILEAGGQWTDDVPENVLLGMAWSLLGEVLKERAASDEVVFGAPALFKELVAQSALAYRRAGELDPSDTTSFVNALELAEEKVDQEMGED